MKLKQTLKSFSKEKNTYLRTTPEDSACPHLSLIQCF